MQLITDAEVAQAFSMGDAIDAMHEAFLQLGQGRGAVLPRQRATAAEVTFSAMGAVLPEAGVAGAKVYTTIAGRFSFVVLLMSTRDGRPLAAIEANELTRLRTAAATAVAVRTLAREDATTLTVYGAGTQAQAHLQALAGLRRWREVLVCARSGGEDFARQITQQHGLPARSVTAEEATARGDVIVTCTRATDPLFDGSLVRPGTLVCAVGASKPSARELDDRLLQSAAQLVVEWRPAALAEAGELVRAAPGVVDERRIVELGELLAEPSRRPSPQDIVVYKSVGIGLQDVALAHRLLQRLR